VYAVDARVIAATSRDLEQALARGEFRGDLHERLRVAEIVVPPLRERKEEIPLLASRLLARFNEQLGRNRQLSPEAIARLVEYSWPGNVRELEDVIRRMVVLADRERPLEALMGRAGNAPAGPRPPATTPEGVPEIVRRGVRQTEREALAEVLERVQWNHARAAQLLGVSHERLLGMISEYELKPLERRVG
jgi:transcriptional regulator with GAF, ATPase, and Fis domain